MQIVTLYGGLGNQLFQLSTALSICKDDLIVDTSLIGKYAKTRRNDLDQIFKFPQNVKFERRKVANLRLPRFINNSYFISDNTSRNKATRRTPLKILDGYFQNGKILSLSDQVRSIKPYLINTENHINEKNSCIVHVRGDDFFITNSPVLNVEYYHLKIDEMKARGVKHFIITTDDQNYSQKIMEGANCSYSISQDGAVSDFYKIMQSDYKILSNSTFSVWANALGNDNAVVLKDEAFYEKFEN